MRLSNARLCIVLLITSVLLLQFIGCSNVTGVSYSTLDSSITLDNGTIISPDVQKFLEDLRPEYIQAITPVVGETTAKAIERGESVQLKSVTGDLTSTIEKFMESKLGSDYEKYIVKENSSSTKNIQRTTSNVIIRTYSSNAIRDSYIAVVSGAVGHNVVSDKQGYIFPWGSYNTAATYFEARNAYGIGSQDANCVSTSIQDDGCSVTDTAYNTDYSIVYGSIRSGFYPPCWGNVRTHHTVIDSVINNGRYDRDRSW